MTPFANPVQKLSHLPQDYVSLKFKLIIQNGVEFKYLNGLDIFGNGMVSDYQCNRTQF